VAFSGVLEEVEILWMRLRVASSKSDESEDWFGDEVPDSTSIKSTEDETSGKLLDRGDVATTSSSSSSAARLACLSF